MLSARWFIAVGLALAIAAFAATALWLPTQHSSATSGGFVVSAHWVDEATCSQCHSDVVKQWQTSHHHQAMMVPNVDSVRGDFSNVSFASAQNDRATYQFSHSGGVYEVRIGAGAPQDPRYALAYTFGWEPLQQYLVATERGRLQAFGVAWDTQDAQWFHLYEGFAIHAEHPLHWQQRSQNANTQCIECHTSNYQLSYDTAQDRFTSTWQNLGVGCQACHGPASQHVDWANSKRQEQLPQFGFVIGLGAREHAQQQLETCAQCHSRRTPLELGGQPASFHDNYLLSPLSADLYEVDGQIRDEVFEYGSFLQSKMAQQGVVCSDCHSPHSGQPKFPNNGTCTQCHHPNQPALREGIRSVGLRAANYDAYEHHFHPQDSPGAACQSCHMPSKTYMGNDVRHDHSFSVPNPEQAIALGHPDACLSCHSGEDPEHIITMFKMRYPNFEARDGGYAVAMFKARRGKAGAVDALFEQLVRSDLPAIRYAALLEETRHYPATPLYQKVLAALQHSDALIRRSALTVAATFLPAVQMHEVLAYMQQDPVRSVRITAAELILAEAQDSGSAEAKRQLTEFTQIQQGLLGRPEAHFSLAAVAQLGANSQPEVRTRLLEALRLAPDYTPALVGYAEWLEQASPEQGLAYLTEQVARWPANAELHFALALAQIRSGLRSEGVQSLQAAYTRAPENDYYAYVLALAWRESGEDEQALALLREQLQKNPRHREIRQLLINDLDPHNLTHQHERQQLLDVWYQQNPYDPWLQRYLTEFNQ